MVNVSINIVLYASYLGVVGFTLFLAGITYQSNVLLKTFRPDFNILLAPPEVLARFGLIGICLFLMWLSGQSKQQFGLLSPNLIYSLGLGCGIGLALQLILKLVTRWALSLFGPDIYSPTVIECILPRNRGEWPLVILALIPAVAMEELLFRALWLGLFRLIIPLPWLIVGTSIIFGLMHLPQGKLGIIVTGGINIVLCLLFIGTNELLLVFMVHYTINILQLVVAYFQGNPLINH